VAVKAGDSLEVRAIPDTTTPTQTATVEQPPAPSARPGEAHAAAPSTFWAARNIVPLGLLVGGVVFAGVGGSFALDAHSNLQQADSLVSGPLGGTTYACSTEPARSGATCQALSDLKSSYDRQTALSTGFFITGGVLVAAAIVTWIVWPKPAEAPTTTGVRITPFASPAGVGAFGTF
jgi:hypothetical protein